MLCVYDFPVRFFRYSFTYQYRYTPSTYVLTQYNGSAVHTKEIDAAQTTDK